MNTYADIMCAYGAWAAIRLVHARQSCVKQDLTEVCERRVDLWGKQNSKKKEAETTLVTTEATQQKKHTTHNLYIFIRCHFGTSLLALVFAPYIFPPSSIGVRTLPFTFRWSQLCRLIVSEGEH